MTNRGEAAMKFPGDQVDADKHIACLITADDRKRAFRQFAAGKFIVQNALGNHFPERFIVEDPMRIGRSEILIDFASGFSVGLHCGMVLLEKAHIGEVQASVWPQEMIDACRAHRIHLL